VGQLPCAVRAAARRRSHVGRRPGGRAQLLMPSIFPQQSADCWESHADSCPGRYCRMTGHALVPPRPRERSPEPNHEERKDYTPKNPRYKRGRPPSARCPHDAHDRACDHHGDQLNSSRTPFGNLHYSPLAGRILPGLAVGRYASRMKS
jgi:hypothetical protein